MRYERYLEIANRNDRLIQLIRSDEFPSPALAHKLAVSEQTTYRDSDFFKKRGYSNRSEMRSGGWACLLGKPAMVSKRKRSSRKWTADTYTDWRKELSIGHWKPPSFFSRKEDIDAYDHPIPHAHALRRAFDRLDLDGILCLHHNPVAYFKEVSRIDPEKVKSLHRQFWNQGLAPILVLIDPKDVYVYTGLTAPLDKGEEISRANCLVQKLNRVAEEAELRQFVLAIESGEFFRAHSKSFDPKQRVDRELLRNLQATRNTLPMQPRAS